MCAEHGSRVDYPAVSSLLLLLTVPKPGAPQDNKTALVPVQRSLTAKPEKTFPKHTAQVPPFPNELSTMRLNGGENDSVKKEVGPRPKSGKNIGMNEHKGKTGNKLRK